MEILYLLIPLSLILVALVVWAISWAVNNGQFDDLEGPAYRVLEDDEVLEADPKDETELGS